MSGEIHDVNVSKQNTLTKQKNKIKQTKGKKCQKK